MTSWERDMEYVEQDAAVAKARGRGSRMLKAGMLSHPLPVFPLETLFPWTGVGEDQVVEVLTRLKHPRFILTVAAPVFLIKTGGWEPGMSHSGPVNDGGSI